MLLRHDYTVSHWCKAFRVLQEGNALQFNVYPLGAHGCVLVLLWFVREVKRFRRWEHVSCIRLCPLSDFSKRANALHSMVASGASWGYNIGKPRPSPSLTLRVIVHTPLITSSNAKVHVLFLTASRMKPEGRRGPFITVIKMSIFNVPGRRMGLDFISIVWVFILSFQSGLAERRTICLFPIVMSHCIQKTTNSI